MNFETSKSQLTTCVDSQLECFKFNNPKLFAVANDFLNKLRVFFVTFPNLNFQIEKEMFKTVSINGEPTIVELCISMNLFNLPVFFRINQNSLILVMTSVEMCDFVPNESWLKYSGCYVQKTFLEDPKLLNVFRDTVILMEGFSQSLMKDIAIKQQEILLAKAQILNSKNYELVWQAPLIASISSLIMSDEISTEHLTNIEFLIQLLLNTGVTASLLVTIDWLLDKIKNEFKS